MTLEPAFIARLQLAKSAASCGQDGMPGLIYLPSILLRWKHSPCPRRLTEPEALQWLAVSCRDIDNFRKPKL